MIVYKNQGINWHPQSDSLGVSPLKRTQSTHPLVSGLHCLLESLRQLICFIGCFTDLVDIGFKVLPYIPHHDVVFAIIVYVEDNTFSKGSGELQYNNIQ